MERNSDQEGHHQPFFFLFQMAAINLLYRRNGISETTQKTLLLLLRQHRRVCLRVRRAVGERLTVVIALRACALSWLASGLDRRWCRVRARSVAR